MANFAERLRLLRKQRSLRQKDLAAEMGLAQTTIANYEQGSRFPDGDILQRLADYFDASLDYLLGRTELNVAPRALAAGQAGESAGTEQQPLSDLARRYLQALLAGEREGAARLVVDAARAGREPRTLYLEVLEPALKEVGRLWGLGELDVAQEHYVSAATESVMSQLYACAAPAARNGRRCVAVSVSGESHSLGIRMVSDFLEMAGWESYFLGSGLPVVEILRALEDYRPDLLALSATMRFNVEAAGTLIRTVRQTPGIRQPTIMVGGRAFAPAAALWRRVGADGCAASAPEAVEVAARLAGLPAGAAAQGSA